MFVVPFVLSRACVDQIRCAYSVTGRHGLSRHWPTLSGRPEYAVFCPFCGCEPPLPSPPYVRVRVVAVYRASWKTYPPTFGRNEHAKQDFPPLRPNERLLCAWPPDTPPPRLTNYITSSTYCRTSVSLPYPFNQEIAAILSHANCASNKSCCQATQLVHSGFAELR